MSEIWKDICGYDGYQASSLGRVRSLDREVKVNRTNGTYFMRRVKGKVLSPGRHSNEHPYPYVAINGRSGPNVGVHVAVCLAFHGERPPGLYACHEDGDPENNIPTNVYWGTPKQNQEDRRKHGTSNCGVGRKLDADKVAEIKSRLVDGDSQDAIAADLGISQSMVSKIKSGKLWAA